MRRALKPHSLLRRRSLWCDEGGISSVEYALLLSYLAGSIALAANFLGGAVSNEITVAPSSLPEVSATPILRSYVKGMCSSCYHQAQPPRYTILWRHPDLNATRA
jgi:Flp pilus assembly pilin Flp